ncbi:MAG: hypothetical protein M3Z46_02060 [Actinomycetota bacterium]|nr:hypothetical protein [Actinomycetota bacterium]
MAFGQQSGPPASTQQIRKLSALLEQAGYGSFREARHPLGLTQRQAGGKFTAAEAETYIDQLEDDEHDSPVEPAETVELRADRTLTPSRSVPSSIATERREARQAESIREVPAPILARELEGRGWILIPPDDLTAPGPPTPRASSD